jgi:flagellin
MGLTVNTNTQSIFAQRALGKNTLALQRSIEHLSTGFRINRAGDDAAGLSISEKMTSQVKGLDKAKQNSSDGISLIQTAEGALSIIQDNLQRIRELVVQGSNGTNGAAEKDALQRELNERVRTIDAIAQATKFNGISIIYDNDNGAGDNVTLQTGADNGQTTTITLRAENNANEGMDIDIAQVRAGTAADYGHLFEGIATANFAVQRMQISGASVLSVEGANEVAVTISHVDTMIANVSRMGSYLGAMQNSLESKIEYLDVARENMEAARSRIKDVDVAAESSVLVKNQILQQSAASMLGQANSTPQIALSLLPR